MIQLSFYTFLGSIVFFLTFGILILYFYFKKQYKYWGERNIPHGKPIFPFGSLKGIQKEASVTFFKKLYDEAKGQKYYGLWFLQKPTLLIKDLDLVRKILLNNFADFEDHGTFLAADDDPASVNLFTLTGKARKDLKATLSPMFTAGKVKKMVPCISRCANDMKDMLAESAKIGDVIDVKEISSRFIADVLLSLVFGVQSYYSKNPESKAGKMAENSLKFNKIAALKISIAFFLPGLAKNLKQPILPKELIDFFRHMAREVVEYRVKNNIRTDDIMQSLIDLFQAESNGNLLNQESKENQKCTFDVLVIQALTFLMGGHDTSAAAMSFALFELAANQEIQNQLREEIKNVLADCNNEQLSYDTINGMEYLGRVIDETLRKYPPAATLQRVCGNGFKDQDSDLTLDKGTFVLIPIYSIHRDEKYFPNPEKFNPDRFKNENKTLFPKYAFIPFAEGPRYCIGQTLALIQVKIGIIALLSKFRIDISDKYSSFPLELDPKSIVTSPKGKLMLKITILNNQEN